MKVKHLLAISLILGATSMTGIVVASCGSCGDSACSSDSASSSCACADPGAVNSSSCTGSGRYCELFGNVGALSLFSDDLDAAPESISYDDYRGTDEQFNQRSYNVDAPRERPHYK